MSKVSREDRLAKRFFDEGFVTRSAATILQALRFGAKHLPGSIYKRRLDAEAFLRFLVDEHLKSIRKKNED